MSDELPDALFGPLATRIAETSGIRIPVAKRWLLASRVAERIKAAGGGDVAGYVARVLDRGGEPELGQLIEAVRVGETQFFRHQSQLRAIRRVALPEIVARKEREGTKGVRVWSAGCASGEEAYTLAMLLEDVLPAADGWTHEVLATDLSEVALERARRGRYPASAAAGVPPAIARWAIDKHGDEVSVSARARRVVRFERQNLLDAVYPRGFDLILCRNVLIYFDRSTQREVIERLSRSLLPGGYLALGYAERLDEEVAEMTSLRTEDGVLHRRNDGTHLPAGGRRRGKPPRPPRGAGSQGAAPKAAPRSTPAHDHAASRRAPASTTAVETRDGQHTRPAHDTLSGRLEGEPGERAARAVVSHLLAQRSAVRLDLRHLTYADDGVARVLARAAAAVTAQGRELRILVASAGTERFLRRHHIVPPALLEVDE